MHNALMFVVGCLPAPARRALTPTRLTLLAEFLRFGMVGTAGVVVDTLVIYALRRSIGPAAAGIVSYLVAATCSWALNRSWTFRGRGSGAWHTQWMRFLMANLPGAVLNRGTYLILIASSPLCLAYPVVPVAAGAIAGMFVNFGLSRRLVFR
jgi:putative flippase GtrA